ncbi:hypothetical protein [Longimicrobium sp.]|uniref:hypothetical protein n=1 Tax=Longimicrobium sp. TaxID=2029185 RepID=UPI002E32495F|nr:hypothetical protein [Longimicrobium sp.]HEX6037183.1 hypothetical protein [Longimicrobium sp.]
MTDEVETTVLWRPVGRAELALIEQSGWTAFPPRLEHQPFFYPVANENYAAQIARDWNTKDAASGYTGFVTRFRVRSDHLARHPLQTAGARVHQEYWIPAEEMDAFNQAIVGPIEVVAEFHGEGA